MPWYFGWTRSTCSYMQVDRYQPIIIQAETTKCWGKCLGCLLHGCCTILPNIPCGKSFQSSWLLRNIISRKFICICQKKQSGAHQLISTHHSIHHLMLKIASSSFWWDVSLRLLSKSQVCALIFQGEGPNDLQWWSCIWNERVRLGTDEVGSVTYCFGACSCRWKTGFISLRPLFLNHEAKCSERPHLPRF